MGDTKPKPVMPTVDPRLEQIKQQAENDKIAATQKLLGQETDEMLRRYSAKAMLSGASVTPPLTMAG